MRHRDDDREDFRADYGDGSEPEHEPDERLMAEGGPEFEPEDYCERHGCWKPFCKDENHEEEEDSMKFTDNELHTIVGALRVAREQYLQDKRDLSKPNQPAGYERLAKQFDKQAEDCDALLERIAQAEGF